MKRVLRYLKGTIDYKITYGNNHDGIVGHSDADWASDLDQCKSTTGYLYTICVEVVFHGIAKSKRQSHIS